MQTASAILTLCNTQKHPAIYCAISTNDGVTTANEPSLGVDLVPVCRIWVLIPLVNLSKYSGVHLKWLSELI